MIPDIAVIIAAYAAARLIGEYILPMGEKYKDARLVFAVIALAIIGYFLFDVIQQSQEVSNSLSGL